MTSNCIRHRAELGLLLALMLSALPVMALESDRNQAMDITARDSDIDLESGVHQLIGKIEIRQGSLLIEADRGEVHQPGGGQEVSRVVLEGTPARLEQALDNGAGFMRARAARIDFDRASNTIVMTGGVRIEDPRGTLTGERVSYDITRGRVQGQSSGEDGRVRFVIPPRQPQAATGSEAD
jgi:lipopolysaccharide export system protein LptA